MKNLKLTSLVLFLVASLVTLPMFTNASVQSDEIPIAEHYEGGTEQLKKDIHAALQYPPAAKRNRIQGTQQVSVTLKADGTLSNLRCLNSLGGGCCEANNLC